MQLIPKRGNEEPLHGTRATRAPTFSTTCAAEMPNCSQVSGWISTVLGSRLCSTAGVTVSLNFVASHVGTLLSSLIVPERRKARGCSQAGGATFCYVILDIKLGDCQTKVVPSRASCCSGIVCQFSNNHVRDS